jgi:hypothetical protein
MALVTRIATASMDLSSAQFAHQIPGLVAGEALDIAAPCYIDTDGLVYLSNATAVDKEAQICGWTPRAYLAGEPVTLMGEGARFKYGSGLTPGAVLYLGATNGRLDTAATTGDAVGCARVVSATDVEVFRCNPELAASSAINGNNVGTVANANVVGGIPVVFRINVADATGNTDVVSTHKIRVIDFWFQNTGIAAHAANDTIQLLNGANAITGAIAKTATVAAVKRADILTAANQEIAAGGTIRIAAVKDTNAAVTAYVMALRIA